MTPHDILKHFRQVATWVDWDGCTADIVLHGNPTVEVRKLAVCWVATLAQVQRAAKEGANVIVSHEPLIYGYGEGWIYDDQCYRRALEIAPPRMTAMLRAKRDELDRLGVTIVRCHDSWDRFPGIGIPDAWAAHLGFTGFTRNLKSFYGTAPLPPTTAGELAKQVLARTRPLGQSFIKVFHPDRKVRSVCVGTGAITDLGRMMQEAPADCYLVTNDGTQAWTTEVLSTDWDIPLLLVDHATAELPGIETLTGYLRTTFPHIPVSYLPHPCPYQVNV